MSFLIQYLVLRAVLLDTHKAIQTPVAFALPYDQLKVLRPIWLIPLVRCVLAREQWKTCCVLHNLGLVEMKHGAGWPIAVTTGGAVLLTGLKSQAVQALCRIVMAEHGGVHGFRDASL